MPKSVEQVQIKPETINLRATMVRANLSAAVTSAKLGNIMQAENYLNEAKNYLYEIASEIRPDNPALG